MRTPDLKQFETFLSDTMGLDAESVGHDRLSDVLVRTMSREGLDAQGFFERLHNSSFFRNQIYDEITVPETWFMRGPEALERFGRYVMEEWLPKNPASTGEGLRVLSVPCATGEEPYSIAMTLASLGFPMTRLEICAVDISCAAIETARAGVFRRYAFRGVSQDLMDRYFSATANGMHTISSEIKDVVHYIPGNIIHDDFLAMEKRFHVIFCRNLLIYLNQTSRRRAVRNLSRLLAADGLVFAGASETGCFGEDYEMIPGKKIFAFRRSRGAATRSVIRDRSGKSKVARSRRKRSVLPKTTVSLPTQKNVKTAAAKEPVLQFCEVKELADAGQFLEAETLCRKYLEQHPLDADGLCLQGVIRGARGDMTGAEESLGQALYADPKHVEALSHMVLLLRERGQIDKLKVYEKRLISSK